MIGNIQIKIYKKMKKKILKWLPILIGITAIADTQFELLISIGVPKNYIDIIRLLGLILALFTPSVQNNFSKRQSFSDNTDPMPNGTPKKKF
jgi:hypothetical protein